MHLWMGNGLVFISPLGDSLGIHEIVSVDAIPNRVIEFTMLTNLSRTNKFGIAKGSIDLLYPHFPWTRVPVFA